MSLARVETAFNLLMKLHAPLRHGSEVAWALWGCLLFQLCIDKDTSAALLGIEDSFVSLLLLHAQDMGLTKKKLANNLLAELFERQQSSRRDVAFGI